MPTQSTPPSAASDLHFPTLERLMEQENFDDLNNTFLKAYQDLEAIAKGKADASRKKGARMAMRALELTMNLMRDFLQVKEELVKQGLKPQP